MKPKLPVKQYNCNICGMVLINSKELLKHQIAVHVDKMFQCQSCNKVFGTKKEFEKHATEIHGSQQNVTAIPANYNNGGSSNSIGRISKQRVDNDVESNLFRKAAHRKKARKRVRGPYRKSVAS